MKSGICHERPLALGEEVSTNLDEPLFVPGREAIHRPHRNPVARQHVVMNAVDETEKGPLDRNPRFRRHDDAIRRARCGGQSTLPDDVPVGRGGLVREGVHALELVAVGRQPVGELVQFPDDERANPRAAQIETIRERLGADVLRGDRAAAFRESPYLLDRLLDLCGVGPREEAGPGRHPEPACQLRELGRTRLGALR